MRGVMVEAHERGPEQHFSLTGESYPVGAWDEDEKIFPSEHKIEGAFRGNLTTRWVDDPERFLDGFNAKRYDPEDVEVFKNSSGELRWRIKTRRIKNVFQRKFRMDREDEESMWPAYKPGDHVLTFNWGKLGIGNAVVFRKGAKFYVKRVSSIKAGLIHVAGDNMAKSEKMPPMTVKAIIKVRIINIVVAQVQLSCNT